VTVNVLANDSDADGTLDRATVALATLPASGTATVNATTGVITYTPAAASSGAVSFTYTVKDNNGATSNAATVVITIIPGNRAPVAQNGGLATFEGRTTTGTLIATDPEGAALTFTIVTNGTKGTVTITDAGTGAYTYVPNASANGTDSFTFHVSDGALTSNLATVTVTIAPANGAPGNDAPVPSASAIVTDKGTAATSQVVPNDPNAGNTHTYTITLAPDHGIATVSASGLLTYTPALNYSGADRVAVTVTDQSGASGQVTIPVTVAAVDNPPLAVGAAVAMNDPAATPPSPPIRVRASTKAGVAKGRVNQQRSRSRPHRFSAPRRRIS
jgi:VCBS repeat-containing protein